IKRWFVVWLVRFYLLEPRCRRIRAKGPARSLPTLAGVGSSYFTHTCTRRAAARTMGIRRGTDGRFSSRTGLEIFTDALHLCTSQRLFRAWLSNAAHTVLRVSERSDIVDDR